MSYQEIKGSRNESTKTKVRTGVMLGITDNDSGIPVVGTNYFTPEGGSVESGLTGRICAEIELQRETLPGLSLVVTKYQQFRAHA